VQVTYRNRILRGSLVLFGVALGLIGTAGGASAEEAAPAPVDDSAHVRVADEPTIVEASSAPGDDAQIGDGLFIERPAPRPDPASELRSDPAPASSPAPAPVPVAPAAVTGGAAVEVAPAAAAAPASPAPVRATQVRGVQNVRSAADTSTSSGRYLARTGLDSADLTVVAGALLALGMLLVQATRPRRTAL
jgi:hypothetical protein